MSVEQLIAELKALPEAQRMQVVDAILAVSDDSWEGMKDIEEGRVVDMETALFKKPPGAA